MEHSTPTNLPAATSRRVTPFGPGFLIAALASTAVVAVAMAIPTDIIDNPWFIRMTATTGIQYFFWVVTSLLMGALVATYIAPRVAGRPSGVAGLGGGVLAYLAIGCPICNKLWSRWWASPEL